MQVTASWICGSDKTEPDGHRIYLVDALVASWHFSPHRITCNSSSNNSILGPASIPPSLPLDLLSKPLTMNAHLFGSCRVSQAQIAIHDHVKCLTMKSADQSTWVTRAHRLVPSRLAQHHRITLVSDNGPPDVCRTSTAEMQHVAKSATACRSSTEGTTSTHRSI